MVSELKTCMDRKERSMTRADRELPSWIISAIAAVVNPIAHMLAPLCPNCGANCTSVWHGEHGLYQAYCLTSGCYFNAIWKDGQ